MYVSMEAAMGMIVADGDESTIVVFVCVWECTMEVSVTNIFDILF
jgi:hypothetical protein